MFADTPGSSFSRQLPSLPAIMFLLPVTNYLLFSVIVRRPQGFLFPTEARDRSCFSLVFSLELMVLFSVGRPSSFCIFAFKASSRKTKLLVEIPSEGGWPASQDLSFPGVCSNHKYLPHQWSCCFLHHALERGFCLLNKEKCCKAWTQDLFLCHFCSSHLLLACFEKLEVQHGSVPSLCRDTQAYSQQRDTVSWFRHWITLCRISGTPQEEPGEFSSLID